MMVPVVVVEVIVGVWVYVRGQRQHQTSVTNYVGSCGLGLNGSWFFQVRQRLDWASQGLVWLWFSGP